MIDPLGVGKVVKAVRFHYRPTLQTIELLTTFRDMVNHAIDICPREKVKGRLDLRNRICREFRERYGVTSPYPYSVAEVAWSITKKHRRWQRRPVATRLMMKLEARSCNLNCSILSLPFRVGEPRILIPLQYGDYQRSFLMDTTLRRGSVTITDSTILIAFSKEMTMDEPLSKVGYDSNEKSIVGSDGAKFSLSEVSRLHTEYGLRRSKFYRKHPDDRRLAKKFAGSRRERERVKQFLHRVAREIVAKAKVNRQAIVLENLKDIRHAHQRGNGEGKARRRRLGLWPFRQLQDFIDYKAKWDGVLVAHADPSWSSKTCHSCGFVDGKLKLTEIESRCPRCGATLDRDLNAAVNIERRGKIECLGVVRPGAQGMNEAVKRNERPTALTPGAEALKLGS